MAASAKKPPDFALLLGGAKGDGDSMPPMPMGDEEDMGEEPAGDEDELPPGFAAAVEEYEAAEGSDERARALYRAFSLCK